MSSRRLAIVAASALVVAGGGAAIAATDGDKGKEIENAILSGAAERLDVETDDLRNALSEAQLEQIDQAVEDGMLTEEQAEMIKEHLEESGRVLGFGPPGGPPGFGGPFHRDFGPGPGGPPVFEAIAEELGISVERLHRQLLRGKSMKKIAEQNGTTLADVKAAAKAAIEEDLDKKVEDGELTEEQADEIRENLPEIIDMLARGPRIERGHGFFRERPGIPGGPGMFGAPGGPPGDMGPPSGEFWQ